MSTPKNDGAAAQEPQAAQTQTNDQLMAELKETRKLLAASTRRNAISDMRSEMADMVYLGIDAAAVIGAMVDIQDTFPKAATIIKTAFIAAGRQADKLRLPKPKGDGKEEDAPTGSAEAKINSMAQKLVADGKESDVDDARATVIRANPDLVAEWRKEMKNGV